MIDLAEIQPWVSVAIALGLPAAIWRYFDARREKDKAREDRQNEVEDKERELISGQRDRLLADYRTDLDTCRGTLVIITADRNRGWDLARTWSERAYHYRIGWLAANATAREARQIANSLVRFIPPEDAAELTPTWSVPLDGPPAMPPFDDLKP